jgi:4-oxalocrotonate tautomerase
MSSQQSGELHKSRRRSNEMSGRCREKYRETKSVPIINVKLVEGVFAADQKQELLSKLTDAVESVYPGLRDVTFVTVEEVRQGAWGIGGQSIDAQKVVAHAEKNLAKS